MKDEHGELGFCLGIEAYWIARSAVWPNYPDNIYTSENPDGEHYRPVPEGLDASLASFYCKWRGTTLGEGGLLDRIPTRSEREKYCGRTLGNVKRRWFDVMHFAGAWGYEPNLLNVFCNKYRDCMTRYRGM
jgi:hypothetical protein